MAGIFETRLSSSLRSAGEEVVGLGQDAGEPRVCLLDLAHGVVDLRADVLRLGEVEEEFESGVVREVEDAFGAVASGVIRATATARRSGGIFQLGALGDETDFGEAEEDDAEDWAGVFLGLEAGIRLRMVGGTPEASRQRLSRGILLRRGDPMMHRRSGSTCCCQS